MDFDGLAQYNWFYLTVNQMLPMGKIGLASQAFKEGKEKNNREVKPAYNKPRLEK